MFREVGMDPSKSKRYLSNQIQNTLYDHSDEEFYKSCQRYLEELGGSYVYKMPMTDSPKTTKVQWQLIVKITFIVKS